MRRKKRRCAPVFPPLLYTVSEANRRAAPGIVFSGIHE